MLGGRARRVHSVAFTVAPLGLGSTVAGALRKQCSQAARIPCRCRTTCPTGAAPSCWRTTRATHHTSPLPAHPTCSAKVLVHRKGATRAFPPHHPALPPRYAAVGQPVLIGGSMGTHSYVLAGGRRGRGEGMDASRCWSPFLLVIILRHIACNRMSCRWLPPLRSPKSMHFYLPQTTLQARSGPWRRPLAPHPTERGGRSAAARH